ncbi:MAG: GAF domain-containing protein [Defluviitaleaceae bacterium]|nr:GAF domain-containing protein [Defluviitaleaceae bacterium]
MITIVKNKSVEKNYIAMINVIKDFLDTEDDIIANLANISAIINCYVEKLNWVGFYILKDEDLVLGPFQGNPACIRIKAGAGVCQYAVRTNKTVNVPNVNEFEGHIACDSKTLSELVVPVYKNNNIYAILDLDSPFLNRFSALEENYISKVCSLISDFLSK